MCFMISVRPSGEYWHVDSVQLCHCVHLPLSLDCH